MILSKTVENSSIDFHYRHLALTPFQDWLIKIFVVFFLTIVAKIITLSTIVFLFYPLHNFGITFKILSRFTS